MRAALALLVLMLTGCDGAGTTGTTIRATVTVDGRTASGALAQLRAREPGSAPDAYSVDVTSGRTGADGRVTLTVPNDGAVPNAALGYRLDVLPPAGLGCSAPFRALVPNGTDQTIAVALTGCAPF